jgi:hypothetical protein
MDLGGRNGAGVASVMRPSRTGMWHMQIDAARGGVGDEAGIVAIEATCELAGAPDLGQGAREARRFVLRAVQTLVAEHGITQVLDIGAGLPTETVNVHEVPGLMPDGRVVYVDNDDRVLLAGRAKWGRGPSVHVMPGDIREPAKMLRRVSQGALLDLTQPVCVVFGASLDSVPDDDGPWAALATIRDRVAPGSCLVISHTDRDSYPEAAAALMRIDALRPFVPRSRVAVEAMFAGWTLLEPGVTHAEQWRPDEPLGLAGPSQTTWMLVGVGRKDA